MCSCIRVYVRPTSTYDIIVYDPECPTHKEGRMVRVEGFR